VVVITLEAGGLVKAARESLRLQVLKALWGWEPLISSDWLIIETHSALGIKQRHHGLSLEISQAAGEQFERLLQSGVELRSLERDRFRQAAELLRDPALGLRAGDALHLAVALHSHCTQLASFDRQMMTAAAALGMGPALD
jgi:hypothetical protein